MQCRNLYVYIYPPCVTFVKSDFVSSTRTRPEEDDRRLAGSQLRGRRQTDRETDRPRMNEYGASFEHKIHTD